VVTRILLR